MGRIIFISGNVIHSRNVNVLCVLLAWLLGRSLCLPADCATRHAHTRLNPVDFVQLAEANGCVGIRVEKKEDVRAAIDKALGVSDRPTVVEFMVEQAENCWPMISPGKRHDQMLGTYESLKTEGGEAQHRRLDPDEEAKLSLG